MATPIREQVLAAFSLAIETAIVGTPVERNRSREIPADADSYIVVLDGPQIITTDVTGYKGYTTTVTVEIYQRGSTDQLAATALNALYADVVKAAIADYSLGGLSVDVREGDMPDVYIDPEASKPTVAAGIDFEIDYQTSELDPYLPGP